MVQDSHFHHPHHHAAPHHSPSHPAHPVSHSASPDAQAHIDFSHKPVPESPADMNPERRAIIGQEMARLGYLKEGDAADPAKIALALAQFEGHLSASQKGNAERILAIGAHAHGVSNEQLKQASMHPVEQKADFSHWVMPEHLAGAAAGAKAAGVVHDHASPSDLEEPKSPVNVASAKPMLPPGAQRS